MGKLVKYCSACEEGFAEKFGFCPDCGAELQTFEMNPIEAAKREIVEPVTVAVEEPVAAALNSDNSFQPATTVDTDAMFGGSYYQTEPKYADGRTAFEHDRDSYIRSGGFYVTVVEEKNVKQRNVLLMGTTGLMIIALLVGTVYSLYNKNLSVGAINDGTFNAMLIEDVPMVVDESEEKKKDAGGGGGGGGRDEEEETSLGDLADQTKNPVRPPDAKVYRSDNFELKTPVPTTQGTRDFEQKYNRWGDPNSLNSGVSNGTGTGGGQGSGTGTGQGSGTGTGTGSGTGSGSGSGDGDGDGDGTGRGSRRAVPPPPAGVTTAMRIIAKPKPTYTDGARQNNIQGTVILRVTFLASGQIGSIAPVKGLPNGLTEQAIAAARRISFEPKKVNGIPQPVTRQVEYSFSIY